MDSLRNDLDAMTPEDLLARRATLCTQGRRRHMTRDRPLNTLVSALMVCEGFMGGIAAAYGPRYEGWPAITSQICMGLMGAGAALWISTALLEVIRGDESSRSRH